MTHELIVVIFRSLNGWWVRALKSWSPGALCMTFGQLNRLETLCGRLAASAAITAYITLRKEGPCKSGWFQGFLRLVSCLLLE